MRPFLVLALLVLPAFAGCVGGPGESTSVAPDVISTAEDAGARSGPSPAAPRDPYRVRAETDAAEEPVEAIAYPIPIPTNPARDPVDLDLSGRFGPSDCRPLRFGSIDETLRPASYARRSWDLSEHLREGDVFEYDVSLTFRNSDDSWAQISFALGLGNTIHDTPANSWDERGEIVWNWTGQGYRASATDFAFVEVNCEFGLVSQQLAYALRVQIRYADGAIPAEAPFLFTVPGGVERLFVRGVALNPDEGVQSHFRIFGPDDKVVCECALGSRMEAVTVPLLVAGDYVILVDHTANGFLALAFDAPHSESLVALTSEWVATTLLRTETTTSVDKLVQVEFDRVPLFMDAIVWSSDPALGVGKKVQLTMRNDRGEPMRYSWGGHLTMPRPGASDFSGMWLGYWPADWEFALDHHAYAPGRHEAHIQADALRGDVIVLTRHYVR